MSDFHDPTDRFLRLLFCRTVHGALGAATLGCGVQPGDVQLGDGQPGDVRSRDREDASWQPASCEDYRWNLAEKIRPVFDFDYVSRRYHDEEDGPRVLSEYGSLCRGAKDASACREQVKKAESAVKVERYYWLTTSDADVEVWATAKKSRKLLGEIDSRDEAIYLVDRREGNAGNVCLDKHEARPVSGGYEVRQTVGDSACPEMTATQRTFLVTSAGEVNELSKETVPASGCWVDGRRPPGLCSRRTVGGNGALARHFSRAAHFEAASVHSFRVLVRELSALGAPSSLVRRARRAAREEVRHARAMRALARRFGGSYQGPTIVPQPHRSLLELALDNAVEGCVNETFAALAASYQACTARDPEVARVMASVADDETGHASFSWRLARWTESLMDMHDLERVRSARRTALAKLRAGLDREPDRTLQDAAGMPSAAAAHRLLDGIESTLFV